MQAGDPLCTLETTKSTADLEAETEGYVVGIRLQPGTSVSAGARLCYLAQTADWQPPEPVLEPASGASSKPDESTPPPGVRITQPRYGWHASLGSIWLSFPRDP